MSCATMRKSISITFYKKYLTNTHRRIFGKLQYFLTNSTNIRTHKHIHSILTAIFLINSG